MTNVLNFIRWALTHVDPNTVPRGVALANGTATNIGADPWHYLYGTVRAKTTPSRIKERWVQKNIQLLLFQIDCYNKSCFFTYSFGKFFSSC